MGARNGDRWMHCDYLPFRKGGMAGKTFFRRVWRAVNKL